MIKINKNLGENSDAQEEKCIVNQICIDAINTSFSDYRNMLPVANKSFPGDDDLIGRNV